MRGHGEVLLGGLVAPFFVGVCNGGPAAAGVVKLAVTGMETFQNFSCYVELSHSL